MNPGKKLVGGEYWLEWGGDKKTMGERVLSINCMLVWRCQIINIITINKIAYTIMSCF